MIISVVRVLADCVSSREWEEYYEKYCFYIFLSIKFHTYSLEDSVN